MATDHSDCPGQRGAAYLALLLMLVVLVFLAVSGLETAMEERQMALLLYRERVLTDLAESGLEMVLALLSRGGPVPEAAVLRDSGICAPVSPAMFFSRRCSGSLGNPSFLNAAGTSQFGGTPALPDLEWIVDLGAIGMDILPGSTLTVRIAAPTVAGGVASVESDLADTGGNRRASRAEVISSPWPAPLPALESWEGISAPLPVKIHWGDVIVHGDADLGASLSAIPVKDASALVNGDAYAAAAREDGWLDIFTSGRVVTPSGIAARPNVHENQADLKSTSWSYETLKAFARSYGKIYIPNSAGVLREPGGTTTFAPKDVLRSLYNGDGLGFVFIDTLDEQPPKADGSNLATITLSADYLEADLYVAGHLILALERGTAIDILSPPIPEGSNDSAARIPVRLEGIQFNGAILAEGTVTLTRPTRQFGSIVAHQGIRAESDVELWFDWNLVTGDLANMPRVIVLPGSRRTS